MTVVLPHLRPRRPELTLTERQPGARLGHFSRFVFAITLTFSAGVLSAAELAAGLTYLRPGATIAPQTGSVILDLRAIPDATEATPLFNAIAPGFTNRQRIVLALVSPDTPPEIMSRLAALPRCLTIGRSDPALKSDITVTVTAEADRLAFEALAANTDPAKLLVENADKPRYDEATLMREHTHGTEPITPPVETKPSDDPAATGTGSTPDAEIAAPPARIDTVLQRAVHIYRGLVVLKKA